MSVPPPPTRDVTVNQILERSGRAQVPIRNTFVQQRVDGKAVAGPLARIVRRGVASALEQYLLLHAWASSDETTGDFDVVADSRVWARALGLAPDDAGRRTVLRNWQALSEAGVVRAKRAGRLVKVTLLREDGTKTRYGHPGEERDSDYFKLSHAYWTEGVADRLELPGRAMLLVAYTLGDWFWMPAEHASSWYGFSTSTIERGLRELRREGVLEHQWHWKEAPLSPLGWTRENYYRLLPPFGPKGKFAKTAPPALTAPEPNEPSPSRQADRRRGRTKRRKPAAGKS